MALDSPALQTVVASGGTFCGGTRVCVVPRNLRGTFQMNLYVTLRLVYYAGNRWERDPSNSSKYLMARLAFWLRAAFSFHLWRPLLAERSEELSERQA